ncbi:hypothetical protein ES708_10283 [subsurface metagenome]
MDIAVKFGDYDFKKTVSDWDTNIRSKLKTEEKALVDGVSLDNMLLGGREISIRGTLIKSTETALRTAFDALKTALNLGKQYLYFFDDRRVLAAMERFSWKDYPRTYNNPARCEYSIEFKAESPYWESTTPLSPEETILIDGHEWTVNNPGDVNVYPVITITADTTIADLIIQNLTDIPTGEDEGLKFEYEDLEFDLSAPTLIVNCQEGTVQRNGANTIRYFSGAFLKLLPGDNTIKWTGSTDGATKVKFTFRRRFL